MCVGGIPARGECHGVHWYPAAKGIEPNKKSHDGLQFQVREFLVAIGLHTRKAMKVTSRTKECVLWVTTGLALAYVRHGVETGWASWGSLERFFSYWFIHTMGLSVFIVLAGAIIDRFHEFFLGYRRENFGYADLIYVILMTVLMGAACVVLIAHWSPSADE
jgi:hypothetical protein